MLHYTLNPTDIVIDEEGICKVKSPILSEYIFDFNVKKGFYYAPETLKIFKMQSAPNGITNKSAVFTLAVTVLTMLYLTPMTHLYNLDNYTINFEELREYLTSIEDSDIREVLSKMLKSHSYERITFTELEEMLYEMISKNDKNGQTSTSTLQQEQDQISKLEESILRIKQDSLQVNEEQPFMIHS